MFFAERAAAKIPGLPSEVSGAPVRRVAHRRSGDHGRRHRDGLHERGARGPLQDASSEGLDRGVQTIQRNYAVSVARKRFTEDAVAERMARITPQLDLAGFDTVDVVIEAVFEDMALKREIFSALDRVARPDASWRPTRRRSTSTRSRRRRRARAQSSACISSAPRT